MAFLNINCPINYIIMILTKLFNDVLRKPLGVGPSAGSGPIAAGGHFGAGGRKLLPEPVGETEWMWPACDR